MSRSVLWWDSALAAALTAVAFVPELARNGTNLSELPIRQADALAVALTLGQTLPLAVRRLRPAACLAVAAVSFAVSQSMSYPTSLASLGLFIALYSAGAHAGRHRVALGAAVTGAYLVLSIVLVRLRSPERPIDYFTFFLVILGCTAAGAWIRATRAGEDARRRRAEQSAITEERVRIAQELHDVVTHQVTAMVVQADAAQYLIPAEPGRAGESLGLIARAGRETLTELRYLLGVLDAPGDPGRVPALGRIGDLVAQAGRAGQPVELVEDGARPDLSASAELAAYRVVQEALTNAIKHAPGRQTVVRIRYDEEIDIDVTTDGPVIADGDFTAGRGLTGLRERVRTCGGELTAGGRTGGGFSVRARMPAQAAT